MKNMTKTFALSLLLAAAGNSAKAQTTVLPPNRTYTFSGSAATSSTSSTVTYQWYRNGVAIDGANGASYILPANLASGVGVEFKRGAVSNACPGRVVFSNAFYVSFCGIIVDNTCWASENVGSGNAFVSKPDEYSPFFQWNRLTAWAATGSVSGWNSTANTSGWTVNPCPSGWRLPTWQEHGALFAGGYTWANANSAKGNAVAGAFFGPNKSTCTLSNMTNCIFLSAGGRREETAGTLLFSSFYGHYWGSGYNNNTTGLNLYINSSGQDAGNSAELHRAGGLNIRCVQ